MTSEGINTFAKRGETQEEYRKYIQDVLKFKPDIIIDDGGELHISAHKNKSLGIIGGAEETTSGLRIDDVGIQERIEVSCSSSKQCSYQTFV